MPEKFLRLREVQEIVGLARSTIYRRVGDGTFPAPKKAGPKAIRWESTAILEWMRSCPPANLGDLN